MLPLGQRLWVNAAVKYLSRTVPSYHLPNAISLRGALERGAKLKMQTVAVKPEDLALLQYTGGTTGPAKGAMLSHRNLTANLEQIAAWLAPFLKRGEESIITALPLYHIFSLTANCLTFMKLGGVNYLITDPRNLRGFVRTLKNVPFTAITGVNTLFKGLLGTPGFSALDFSRLKVSLAGGMALQESVAARWKAVTGSTLIEAYGLTEASPAACVNPLDLAAYNACIGLPLPSTEVCIQDDSGHLLGPRKVGELCIRGPQVMVGYWQRPIETANVLSRQGWLHTGDIGEMLPDGFFRLLDRKKDMILVSGFKVYPNEVEPVIATHPGVRDVAVIGVPDEHSGEAVMAIVVRGSPALSEADVREHCQSQLTNYKRPKYIQFVEELPKTAVGKVARRELRERFSLAVRRFNDRPPRNCRLIDPQLKTSA
jgi:long-chain acyl-CoA synthetase